MICMTKRGIIEELLTRHQKEKKGSKKKKE